MDIHPTDVIVPYSSIRNLMRGESPEHIPPPSDAQAALELGALRAGLESALVALADEERFTDVMIAPEHGPASLLLSFLAEQAAENADMLDREGKLVEVPGVGLEVKYDNNDLSGWAGSFFTWWRRLRGKHGWMPAPTTPETIGDGFRVAILGDWGSGRYGAPTCAQSIDRESPSYDCCLHLGDVYYAGTKDEVEENFLRLWPTTPRLSRACNSNHEMYTGGRAYFERTLPRFNQPGGSSNFALGNDHWLLVGLDTAYRDHDVEEPQLGWLQSVLAGRDGRGVIFFSHHQPFSSLEKGGGKLREALAPVLESRSVFAWYWGHEHRCVLYDRLPGWGLHGRCIGHSGFPYFRDDLGNAPIDKQNPDGTEWRRLSPARFPGALVLDGPNPYVTKHPDEYGPHGYVTIELSGVQLHERIHAADGTVLKEATLTR